MPDQAPARVLILTNDTGFGHRSTANAIARALKETYGDQCYVEIMNPTEHKAASPLLRNSQADYDRMIREWPEFYRFSYETISEPLPNAIIESAFTVMLYAAIVDILETFKPDVIVNTYETYHAPLDAVFTVTRQRVPLITVVTDLATLHRSWFNNVTDLCLVPTQMACDLAVKYGLAAEKVKITGLPVNPVFASPPPDKATVKAELGWRDDLATVLAVGSTRVRNLPETLHVLNHSGLPVQFVVVCGGDDALYEHFSQTEWHHPAQVYNFVDNLPRMMQAADLTVGKAGGLYVTESLAAGLPILLIDLIQGQETGNADYVVEGGAGELAENPVEALEILFHWLMNDRRLLRVRAANAERLGYPHAVYEAADLIWRAAQQVEEPPVPKTPELIRSLTEMLNNFNVPWKDGQTIRWIGRGAPEPLSKEGDSV